jgi:hypothetical protein
MGLWKKYLEFAKRSRIVNANNPIFSRKTGFYCPDCGNELSQVIGGKGVYLPGNVCGGCGFIGPGLNKKLKQIITKIKR